MTIVSEMDRNICKVVTTRKLLSNFPCQRYCVMGRTQVWTDHEI